MTGATMIRDSEVLAQVLMFTLDARSTLVVSLERRVDILVGTHCVVGPELARRASERLKALAAEWAMN